MLLCVLLAIGLLAAPSWCSDPRAHHTHIASHPNGQIQCSCGHALAEANALTSVSAPDAEAVMTASAGLLGSASNATVSRLRNPHGFVFDLITVRGSAPGGEVDSRFRPTAHATWFPGYEWQILHCGRCHEQIGWRFTQQEGPIAAVARAVYSQEAPQSFVGLVMERMRFTHDGVTFEWSPADETFLASSAKIGVPHDEL